eukprot:9498145-Pyramimonas_sp.AAC.1
MNVIAIPVVEVLRRVVAILVVTVLLMVVVPVPVLRRELRNRGTPHTYIMAGVVIAEVKHVRIMSVAVAPPIPLVTPLKRRGGEEKRRASHTLRARNRLRPHPKAP